MERKQFQSYLEKTSRPITTPDKLLRFLYLFEDERVSNRWKDKYNQEELDFIYQMSDYYKDNGGNDWLFNEVYLAKSFIENDWEKFKDNENVYKLFELIAQKEKNA